MACPALSPAQCTCDSHMLFYEPMCFGNYPGLKIFTIGALAFSTSFRLGRHLLLEMCSALYACRATGFMARTAPPVVYVTFRFPVRGLMQGIAVPVGSGSVLGRLRTVQRQVRRWIAMRRDNEERRLAVAMGLHARVGADSALAALTEDLVRMCVVSSG